MAVDRSAWIKACEYNSGHIGSVAFSTVEDNLPSQTNNRYREDAN